VPQRKVAAQEQGGEKAGMKKQQEIRAAEERSGKGKVLTVKPVGVCLSQEIGGCGAAEERWLVDNVPQQWDVVLHALDDVRV